MLNSVVGYWLRKTYIKAMEGGSLWLLGNIDSWLINILIVTTMCINYKKTIILLIWGFLVSVPTCKELGSCHFFSYSKKKVNKLKIITFS